MKTSIVNRLRLFLLIPLVAILGLSAVLWSFNVRELRTYNENMSTLLEKRNQLRLVQHAFEGQISEFRGFMAIRNNSFLSRIENRKQETLEHIHAYKTLPLTSIEKGFIQNIQHDVEAFNKQYLPEGIALAKAANYKAIHEMAINQGITNFINGIRDRIEVQTNLYTDQLNQAQAKHKDYVTYSLGWGLAVLLFILGLSFWIINRFGRDIGQPLQTLTDSALRFSKGDYTPVTELDRNDELGQLARAFNQMIKDIHEKETNLLTQNQELTAHQEELYAQQIKLEETVGKLTEKENMLMRRNQLSASLATDIEVSHMLSQILDTMLLLTRSQTGAAIILDDEIEERFVSRGIEQEQIDRLISHLYGGMSGRAIQEKAIHTLVRHVRSDEQDYHTTYSVHDLYIPLLNRDEEVVALLILTRLSGIEFTTSEITEVEALARQISLAIENAVSYSKTQRANSINQAILNSALEGISLVDTHGKMVAVNNAWCEMYGLARPEDLTSITRDELIETVRKRLKNPDEVISFYFHAISGKIEETEELTFEMIAPSYRVMKMYHRRVLGEHNETLGWIIVTRDITREYEVDRMKSEFVSTVSHELRTPLSSILGFVEIMLQRKITPDKQMRYLNTIYKEARRLTNLINDFLDVQRMESGKQEYNKEPLPLRDVVEEAIQLQQVATHNIVFRQLTERDIVVADKEKMQQVVTNLLSNAIKYSPNGGTITVTVDTCTSRPQDVCLHVQDEGLGIPEESIPHLFKKFYRVDNSDRRKIGGTGLGLAICSEIIKAHNGLIHVQSKLGEGSTFTVSLSTAMGETPLPKQESHAGMLVSPAVSQRRLKEQTMFGHILIVEDDESLRTYLSEELGNSLVRQGIEIKHVPNGEKALQSITASPPLLIILDIMLGEGKNGWEIVQEIKQNEKLNSIPIIISSALEEKERGYGYGISNYLIKPYPAEKLTTTVWNLLQNTSQEGHIFIPKEKG
jgi:PAS domain S-box-containing protein